MGIGKEVRETSFLAPFGLLLTGQLAFVEIAEGFRRCPKCQTTVRVRGEIDVIQGNDPRQLGKIPGEAANIMVLPVRFNVIGTSA